MAFNFITGQYDADGPDLSGTYTDNVGYVQPDVSQGAPAMQPTTPTGNGSGYFIDQAAQSTIFDTLKLGLNYAMQRDQQTMQYDLMTTKTQGQAMQVQQVQQNNTGLFLLLGGGVVLFMLLSGGGKPA